MQRERAAVDVVDFFEDVRRQVKLFVVADEARVAVNDHHPDVTVFRLQRAQLAAIATECPVAARCGEHERHARQSLGYRRQLAGSDVGGEARWLLGGKRWCGERRCERRQRHNLDDQRFHAAAVWVVCIRTRWPSPTSTSSPALSAVHANGARHSSGFRSAPSRTALRSSLRLRSGYGTAASSPSVYGCIGLWNSTSRAAISTIRPRHMTAMSSAM